MSREQRRQERKQQAASGAAPPSRRTPRQVKTDSGLPVMPLAIFGGVLIIVALIAYLIIQANTGTDGLSGPEKAEQDDSPTLPGVFHGTQGRGHFSEGLSGHVTVPFCEGVAQSDLARERSGTLYGETPSSSTTSTREPTTTPTTTPTATSASGSTTPNTTPTVQTGCHNSNPPSSGEHLGVQRNVDIGGGLVINIPPDPDVYPRDVEIPRDAIAHTLEHAGVFVGWNCEVGDTACTDVVTELEDLVNSRIDNNDDRVVMSIDLDLPVGTIGISSWTRVMNFPFAEYDEDAVTDFISTHSCRFDPEGFCR
jgi:hypothetical protein